MQLAQSKILADDDRVLALAWTMPPQSETGQHTHERDYVVVYLTDGLLTVDDGSQNVEAPVEKHQLTSRPAGVSHNVMNLSDSEISFIEIEIKASTDRRKP